MRSRLDHLEEQAELYALGLLAGDDAERVDAHVRTCNECAQRLGRAELTVAAIVDATLPRQAAPRAMFLRAPRALRAEPQSARSQRPWRSWTAWTASAAAAFAIATGSLVAQNAALRSNVDRDGSVFEAMVRSHFSHGQFAAVDGTPIDAKVIYERHGRWYEILATGIDARTRVAVVRAGATVELSEQFAPRGATLTLALPTRGAIDELRLLDRRGRLLARVRPVLSAR